jgi:hypothetical protein
VNRDDDTRPVSARDRAIAAVGAGWPPGPPGRVLVGLVILGILLRLLSVISWWPTTILEDSYQNFAGTNPFKDPLHPAGYALILGAIGQVTHEIAVPILLQHISGIASALLLFAATRRITRSAWAGLLPAAIILLGGDEVFLEHSIMSESWTILAVSIGLYASVRALDRPDSWRPWPLVAGLALGIAVTIRSADLPIVVVASLALLVARPQLAGWRPALAAVTVSLLVLLAFAGANATFGVRFGIAPSPGWYLYGRVAQFADCSRFTPPPGTAGLCQKTPASQRENSFYYMFIPQAPAPRLFGEFGNDDAVVGGWARRALEAQFVDFLSTAWLYLRSYYVPGSKPDRLNPSTGLDPQLDFTNRGNIYYDAAAQKALEEFFGPFSTHRNESGLDVLRAEQLVVRFGATALFVATILVLIGLAIGTRRSRVGVLLFGIGGLSMLVAPVLTGTYSGRYTVPMAGPLMAAAAITITEGWRAYGRRRGRALRAVVSI